MSDETQAILRGWIETILARRGWTKTHLARVAGVSTTTITRLFDEDYSGTMNAASIAKIARASGVPAPRGLGGVEETPGFAAPEAAPYEGPPERSLRSGQSLWTTTSSGLVAMGLMPGDRFILDQNISPQTRDIIMVQQYDHATGTAETLLRVYADGFAVSPLYLVDGSRRLWIDGANVTVMGVITESWRSRSNGNGGNGHSDT